MRRWRRNTRTILLAVCAMAALPWAAVTQFDMPKAQFLELLLGALGALFLVILAAAAAAGLLLSLRRLWRRRRGSS
ncbi:hypothetical protein [Pseudohaliea sp.]|uniref:hypothetical protein n=1 Tax=Pseudohaliea sp. TaxID=2740289 RepID=UPI0032EDA719